MGGYLLRLVGMNAESIRSLVLQVVPAGHGTVGALTTAISSVKQHSGVFAILALLSFLWASSSLFGCLEQVMADVYGITTRNFVAQKLVAFGMMLLFCILVVAAVGGTTLTAFLRQLKPPSVPRWIVEGTTGPVLSAVVGVAGGLILFFVIFWVLPNRRFPPHHALPGAVLSGVMFYVLTLVFPLYLRLNSGINQYGSQFAFLFTLLFFFHFLGLITVLGIEVNAVLFPLPPEPHAAAAAPAPVGRRVPRALLGVLGGVLALALALVAGRATSQFR